MRKLILIKSLLFLSLFVNGQNYIYQQKDNLKAGIYRNFEEFQRNSPSVQWKYSITPKSIGYGMFNAGGTIDAALLEMEKTERKAFGNIYGFCDGKSIYICTEYKSGIYLKKKTIFHKIEYLGKIVYYEDIYYAQTGNGSVKQLSHKYMRIDHGTVYTLTKKVLKNLLKDSPKLLDEFENESNKNRVLKDYLIKYSKTLEQ